MRRDLDRERQSESCLTALLESAVVCQRLARYQESDLAKLDDAGRERHAIEFGKRLYRTKISFKILTLPYIKIAATRNRDFGSLVPAALDIGLDTGCMILGPGPYTIKKPNAADIFHLLLAKHNKCDTVITFDKAMKKMQGHELVDGLEIEVLPT